MRRENVWAFWGRREVGSAVRVLIHLTEVEEGKKPSILLDATIRFCGNQIQPD